MNSRQNLMKQIYETGFAIDEVKLFLNSHPTDPAALAFYNQNKQLYAQAVNEFTEQFGPLTADNVQVTDRWTWVDQPWPWEGED